MTDDERSMAFRYISLVLARMVLERDLRMYRGDTTVKFPEVYQTIVTRAIDAVGREIGSIKRRFAEANIMVSNGNAVGKWVVYFRGHREEIELSAPMMRNYARKAVMSAFGI